MAGSVAFDLAPQHGFAHLKLRQRAIAAAVLRRRSRLEARHSQEVERDVHHTLGTSQEESRAPFAAPRMKPHSATPPCPSRRRTESDKMRCGDYYQEPSPTRRSPMNAIPCRGFLTSAGV